MYEIPQIQKIHSLYKHIFINKNKLLNFKLLCYQGNHLIHKTSAVRDIL